MLTNPSWRVLRLYKRRQKLAVVVAILTFMIAPGVWGRFFRAHELSEELRVHSATKPARLPAPRLVHLEPGGRIEGQSGPRGWSTLVLKSVPNLATGDLDTVSNQAFETARRIRPVIVADIRRSEQELGSTYYLARVGVGLCAPSEEPGVDRVITASSVGGTLGSWTAKQRIILTAMAYEVSRTQLAAATPTFALLRSPSTFLIGGSHRNVESYQALLLDSRSGKLQTIVWFDDAQHDSSSPVDAPARLLSTPVFDCPQDVHATKVLGTPVAWSFAIRELPPGTDLSLDGGLIAACKAKVISSSDSAAIQQTLIYFIINRE